MGVYRVNYRSGMFPFDPGAVFEAADGPSVVAGVRSGVLSRVDWEPKPVEQPNIGNQQLPDQQQRAEIASEATELDPEGELKQEKPKKGK